MINGTNNKQGYILILTLMILTIAAMLVTQLYRRGIVFVHFDSLMIKREKAKSLALSGVELAIDQLTVEKKKKDTPPENEEGKKKEDESQILFKRIFSHLNLWQTFDLKEKVDGIDGQIQLCLMCEEGKIPLNQWFNFEKGEFASDEIKSFMKQVFAALRKFVKNKELFGIFEKFLKQRQDKLNDATELLKNKEFQALFKQYVFYEPPEKNMKKDKRPVFLMDIFSVWSSSDSLSALLFSDSLSGLLNLNRADVLTTKKRDEVGKKIVKDLKKNQSLEELWKSNLKSLYGKDFKNLPKERDTVFTSEFNPQTFSVLSYGIVGGITQRVFAILQKQSDDEQQQWIVRRMYWI